MHHQDHSTAIGTTSGTVLTVFATIDAQDYVKTIVLACVGAVVSFTNDRVFKMGLEKD
jgi:hypothetical protein